MHQAVAASESPREDFFCKVSERSAETIREYGALAYSLLVLAASNARVMPSGRLLADHSAKSLAALSGYSERAVRTALGKLEGGGLIQRRVSNGNRSWIVIETGNGIERFDSATRRGQAIPGPGSGSGSGVVVDNRESSGARGEISAGDPLQKLQGPYIIRDSEKQREISFPQSRYSQQEAGVLFNTEVSGKEQLGKQQNERVEPDRLKAFKESFRAAVEENFGVPDQVRQQAREVRRREPRYAWVHPEVVPTGEQRQGQAFGRYGRRNAI